MQQAAMRNKNISRLQMAQELLYSEGTDEDWSLKGFIKHKVVSVVSG